MTGWRLTVFLVIVTCPFWLLGVGLLIGSVSKRVWP